MNVRNYFLFIFVVVFCFSCSVQPNSTLTISNGDKDFSLVACNNTALNNSITNPSESAYLYYGFNSAFSKNLIQKASDFLPAIEITVSINDSKNKDEVFGFAFGFLYENDFENGKLKEGKE